MGRGRKLRQDVAAVHVGGRERAVSALEPVDAGSGAPLFYRPVFCVWQGGCHAPASRENARRPLCAGSAGVDCAILMRRLSVLPSGKVFLLHS